MDNCDSERSDLIANTSQVNSERSEADGMECNDRNNETKTLIPLPKPHLNKQKCLPPATTTYGKTSQQCTSRRKEPKFIPYEPYKAAVTPMMPSQHITSHLKKLNKSGGTAFYFCHHLNMPEKSEKIITRNEIHLKQCWCTEANKKLEEELMSIRQEKASLEKQLKIQTQVNNDLKKLLVASVGEDMQAKVQYLTEDKIKLAHDIVHYSQKMLEDSEHLEKLSIQCDVWRSKYLASSVMVDELASWKAILRHYLDDSVGNIKVLLDEHEKLTSHVTNTFSYLKNLCEKYELESKPNSSSNGLQMAEECETLARALSDKLTGPSSRKKTKHTDRCLPYKTPGEQLGFQFIAAVFPLDILNGEDGVISSPGSQKTRAFSYPYQSIIPRFHPNMRYEHLTFNCCHHCRGDIKLM